MNPEHCWVDDHRAQGNDNNNPDMAEERPESKKSISHAQQDKSDGDGASNHAHAYPKNNDHIFSC